MSATLQEKLARAVHVYDELNRSGNTFQSESFHAAVARDAYAALARLQADPKDYNVVLKAKRALAEVESELVILCYCRKDKNPRHKWPAARREAKARLKGGATC